MSMLFRDAIAQASRAHLSAAATLDYALSVARIASAGTRDAPGSHALEPNDHADLVKHHERMAAHYAQQGKHDKAEIHRTASMYHREHSGLPEPNHGDYVSSASARYRNRQPVSAPTHAVPKHGFLKRVFGAHDAQPAGYWTPKNLQGAVAEHAKNATQASVQANKATQRGNSVAAHHFGQAATQHTEAAKHFGAGNHELGVVHGRQALTHRVEASNAMGGAKSVRGGGTIRPNAHDAAPAGPIKNIAGRANYYATRASHYLQRGGEHAKMSQGGTSTHLAHHQAAKAYHQVATHAREASSHYSAGRLDPARNSVTQMKHHLEKAEHWAQVASTGSRAHDAATSPGRQSKELQHLARQHNQAANQHAQAAQQIHEAHGITPESGKSTPHSRIAKQASQLHRQASEHFSQAASHVQKGNSEHADMSRSAGEAAARKASSLKYSTEGPAKHEGHTDSPHLEQMRQSVHRLRESIGQHKDNSENENRRASFLKARQHYQAVAGNRAEHIPDPHVAEHGTTVRNPGSSGRWGRKA